MIAGCYIYVFRGRRGDLIKILWHDGVGISLYAKRLERGRFQWPVTSGGAVSIGVGSPHGLEHADKVEQEIAEICVCQFDSPLPQAGSALTFRRFRASRPHATPTRCTSPPRSPYFSA